MTKVGNASSSDMNAVKGLKIIQSLSKIVIISRDVEFDEEDYWCWTEEEKQVRDMFFDNEDDELREVEEADNRSPPTSLGSSTPAASSDEGSSSGGAPRKSRNLRSILGNRINKDDE